MKNKLLALLTVSFATTTLVGMEEERPAKRLKVAEEGIITLISKEGQRFEISKGVAELSGTIKAMLQLPGTREINLSQIGSTTLQGIINVLRVVDWHIQLQNREMLVREMYIKRPADGGLIAKNILPIVDSNVREGIEDFILAANFLGIPSLVNAGAQLYIASVRQRSPNVQWATLVKRLRKQFPQELLIYFKKHFILNQAGAKEELSIADSIALYGQPKIAEGGTLGYKGITSLHGIDKLANPEKVKRLLLGYNFILGPDADPDFPNKPF